MRSHTKYLTFQTRKKREYVNITADVQTAVQESKLQEGMVLVSAMHITAGVFINENADPDALSDMLQSLEALVPWENGYRHAEGNAAAHIKATLVGTSQVVPVRNGRLALGRWQGIFFADFDGPRERHFQVTVLA